MASSPRCLTALPVYNEAKHLSSVLDEVVSHACSVLVVDDGSTDGGSQILAKRVAERNDIQVVRHETNRGYGAALKTAFEYAIQHNYDVLITIDCDGQHEPQLISKLAGCVFESEGDHPLDIVSGSRYLKCDKSSAGTAPQDRRRINLTITKELNELLGLALTDAFCGFKAYRVAALGRLELTEPGYAMPLELWVQAAKQGLHICEMPVPLIYLDEERSFGGSLDQADKRLAYYREVIGRAMDAMPGPARAITSASPCDLAARAASAEPC